MRNIHKKKRIVCCILLLGLLLSCTHMGVREEKAGKNSSIYDSVLGVYRGPLNHLSSVRRGECPMHPSCSEYSRRVVEKHGFAIGWMMTLDRLLRCGRDELKTAPKIFVNGQWKYYDPVENNDFWWRTK